MKILFIVLVFLVAISSCRQEEKKLFELVKDSGIDFNNKVVDGELENSFYFRNYYNGGGVAIGDINNDGLSDVMLTSNMGENKLYVNKGDLKFEDISKRAGLKQDSMWSTGVVMADINSDGWLDIYECNSAHMQNGNRRNKLYINNRDLTFTESAAQYGLNISAYTTQVSFFDYDLDGDLDCFVINNSPMPAINLGYSNKRDVPDAEWAVAEFLKGGGDHLYRNDNNRFTEITKEAGIHGSLVSFGLGVSVSDVNNDGYPDIYVANDSYERDYLYINQKNGKYKDEFEECMEQNSFSSMGADIADVNNDGYMDIFTTDMLPADDYRLKTLGAFDNIDLYNKRIEVGLYRQFMKNCLYINDKNGRFLETANYSGVAASDWSWGALFFDADNDGLNDIYVCNGINKDVTNLDFMDFFGNEIFQKMVASGQKQSVDSVLQHIPVFPIPNKAFRNNGNLQFSDMSESWGFTDLTFSNGAAYGDLDNDGDLDLVINNENQLAMVYRNNSRQQNGNNYIGVELKGTANNRFAIGAKIKLFKDGQVFYREVIPSRGFQSSVDYKQIIGLGALKEIDSMVVTWPDRSYTRYDDPVLNKTHVLQQPASGAMMAAGTLSNYSTLIDTIAAAFDRHIEDKHIDFYHERNLPEILSTEGPKIAKADVNGDGLEDVYIGGAKDQPGQLYLQTANGFVKKEQDIFKTYSDFEDVAVLFFDADGEGGIDLYIGAGGNNAEANSRELEHRLYKNDGQGNFTIDTRAFPNNSMNISVAVANDYDSDGDLDLFVGSRSVPYNYGVTPVSYIYENDGKGHFKEQMDGSFAAIRNVGMVTDAAWVDIIGDAAKELIIAGEWMPIKIFSYDKAGKKFNPVNESGLDDLYGWWQTITVEDLNADGKMDLALGNIGENFYLRPTATAPVKLWMNDFDQSGTTDQFLTRMVDNKDVPVFLKREITEQFPALKKQNLKHHEYALKTINDLFSKDMLSNAVQKKFNYISSIIAFNSGNGKFRIEPMPQMVQLSSVNAIEVADVNGDNKPDLVMGGNMFSFPPQFGRLDASYGHVLLNDGKGKFNWVSPRESGFFLKGAVKDIQLLKGKGKYLLVVRNNDKPVLCQIKQ